MVVPLQQGGGTRLKLLEAFASGCPAVSTTKGAEGLNVRDGEHLLIRDEIEAITEAVEQLWSKTALVEKLAAAAYELVKAEYSWEAVSKRVDQALQQLL
jgi:glycosyltransferase involved in cell wall biosynthesis